MQRPSLRHAGLLTAAGFVLALGGAPLLVSGADHLDAPALGGLTNMAGDFAPHSDHGDRDINDVYVFQGRNASRTAFVMTTNPAINLFGGSFGTNVRYIINVDRDGDAVQDLAYVWRFGSPNGQGAQAYTVVRYTGSNARHLVNGSRIASGSTGGSGIGTAKGGASVFAGVRSDPFFFDLTGFVGTVFGIGTDGLGQNPTDFFAGLNTNAVVLEVPDDSIGAANIGVWGKTTYWANGQWNAADQMGRPAINTVFNNALVDPNAGQTKNRFNQTAPSKQRTAYDGLFRNNIIATLTNINAALGTGCDDYGTGTAGAIANVLLPDVLTYDTSTRAAGPLNGRALGDDVIDVELGLTTNGCVTSDGVGAHGDYLSSFPYLGVPH
ncbi:MAG TPA: DUF4331 family protein [Candidatus Limnocylindrales bacterium]|jgi:hypothetical protein|nr:DUF4331 family protein [Candidatus Limnocylindrales bacterium]